MPFADAAIKVEQTHLHVTCLLSPNPASTTKDRIAALSLQTAMVAATLWDYRNHNLRVFDFAALGLLAVWFFLKEDFSRDFFRRRRHCWLLYATIAIYALAGLVLQRHNSSLAVFLFAAAGFCLVGQKNWLKAAGPFLWPLVFFHLIFFFIQLVGYYGFNVLVDFQKLIGDSAQLIVSENHIRPSGLFRETHNFCANIFILTSLAILWQPRRAATIVVSCVLIASESLWGVAAALLVMGLNEFRLHPELRLSLYRIGLIGLALTVLATAYFWLHKTAYNQNLPYFFWRLSTLMDDASFQARYLNSCASGTLARSAQTSLEWTWTDLVVGAGLSTKYFTECLPANGFALMLKSFGGVGIAVLAAGAIMAVRRAPISAKIYCAIVIAFSFTSYPLVTYLIFWIWSAGLIILTDEHAAVTGAPKSDSAISAI